MKYFRRDCFKTLETAWELKILKVTNINECREEKTERTCLYFKRQRQRIYIHDSKLSVMLKRIQRHASTGQSNIPFEVLLHTRENTVRKHLLRPGLKDTCNGKF